MLHYRRWEIKLVCVTLQKMRDKTGLLVTQRSHWVYLQYYLLSYTEYTSTLIYIVEAWSLHLLCLCDECQFNIAIYNQSLQCIYMYMRSNNLIDTSILKPMRGNVLVKCKPCRSQRLITKLFKSEVRPNWRTTVTMSSSKSPIIRSMIIYSVFFFLFLNVISLRQLWTASINLLTQTHWQPHFNISLFSFCSLWCYTLAWLEWLD